MQIAGVQLATLVGVAFLIGRTAFRSLLTRSHNNNLRTNVRPRTAREARPQEMVSLSLSLPSSS